MNARIWLVVLGLSCLSGCTAAPATPGHSIEAYAGTSEVTMPDGRTFPAGEIIAERLLKPADSEIIEHVVAAGGRPGTPPREFFVDMAVTGNTLTMKERAGAFTGTGTLTGEAWAWSSWRTEAVLPDGSKVESSDVRTVNGLTVDKTVIGPDGVKRMSLREQFRLIPASEFEAHRSRLLGAKP